MDNDSKKFEIALEKVFQKYLAMSDEEFFKKINSHKEGDIAQAILHSGALKVGQLESDSFEGLNIYTEKFLPSDFYKIETKDIPCYCSNLPTNMKLDTITFTGTSISSKFVPVDDYDDLFASDHSLERAA